MAQAEDDRNSQQQECSTLEDAVAATKAAIEEQNGRKDELEALLGQLRTELEGAMDEQDNLQVGLGG